MGAMGRIEPNESRKPLETAVAVRARLLEIEEVEKSGWGIMQQNVMAVRLVADVLNVLAGSGKYPVRAEREAMAALAYEAMRRYVL